MNFNCGRIGYYRPDYSCRILPEINKSRNEFKVGSNLHKDIKDKVREKEMTNGSCLSLILGSIERKIDNYRW